MAIENFVFWPHEVVVEIRPYFPKNKDPEKQTVFFGCPMK